MDGKTTFERSCTTYLITWRQQPTKKLWWVCRRGPALLVVWYLALHSLPAHKEFRFLLPTLPLFMPYIGLAFSRASQVLTTLDPSSFPTTEEQQKTRHLKAEVSPWGLEPRAEGIKRNSLQHVPHSWDQIASQLSKCCSESQTGARSDPEAPVSYNGQRPPRPLPHQALERCQGSPYRHFGFKALLCFVFVPQLLLAAYFSLVHQRYVHCPSHLLRSCWLRALSHLTRYPCTSLRATSGHAGWVLLL